MATPEQTECSLSDRQKIMIYCGILINGLGNVITTTVLVLVLSGSSTPFLVGGLMIAELLPTVLLGRQVGRFVNARGGVSLYLIAVAGQALLILTLALLIETDSSNLGYLIVVLATLTASFTTVQRTLNFAAVGRLDDSTRASLTGRLGSIQSVSFVLGAAAGSLLYSNVGPTFALVLDASSCAACSLTAISLSLLLKRVKIPAERRSTSSILPWRTLLISRPELRTVAILVSATALGSSLEGPVFSFFVMHVMQVDVLWFGVLNSVWASGSIIGGLAFGSVARSMKLGWTLRLGAAGTGLCLAVPAVAPLLAVIIPSYLVGGFFNSLTNAAATTALYRATSHAERAPLQGAFTGMLHTAVCIGYGAGSLLTSHPRETTFAAGTWCVAALAVGVVCERAGRTCTPCAPQSG